ncbi:MAG TPA: SGNH/GDSL hydrolase family protein [Ruminiclostridium sp.]
MADPRLDFDPITGWLDASVFDTNPANQPETRGFMQRLFTQIQDFINATLIAWVKATFTSKYEITTDRKLSVTGDFTGTILGLAPIASDPYLSTVVAGHTTQLADNVTQFALKANKTEINTLANNKVDKITGKGLSTNDYDATEKSEVAKVANKADTSYVNTQIASVASGSPKATYATLAALAAAIPTGNTNIYVVTADGKWYYWNGSAWTIGGTYQSTGISPASVTPLETSFCVRQVNLFNKNDIVADTYISNSNGTEQSFAGFTASGFIVLKASTQYCIKFVDHYAFYNSAKVYISGSNTGGRDRVVSSPSNAVYIRFSWALTGLLTPAQQISEGNTPKPFEKFGYKLVDALPLVVNPENATFFVTGNNLLNINTASVGYYVNQTDGNLNANASYTTSDFIKVNPNTTYTRSDSNRVVFYDVNQVFISGLASATTVTTPSNAQYMKVSFSGSTSQSRVSVGNVLMPYEPYKCVIPNTLLGLTDTASSLLINIATIIPAVVGHEVNVYFNNIMCVDNINNYQINVVCSKGRQQVERWTYIPVAGDVGDIAITFEVYQKYVSIASVTSTIRVSATTKGTGQTLKVAILGDSTIANNNMINELANLFSTDAMHLTFIGTQGVSPNFHEGYSGRSTNWLYTDAASPFVYSSAFNYATYLSSHSLATPDVVMLNLGINDMFDYTDDANVLLGIQAMITQYDAMIANIKLSNANMKFGICVTVPSGNEDAFDGYNCGQTSWRYNRNNRLLTNALINYFKGKEAQYIYLVPINVNLDTVNNILLNTAQPINSRNPLLLARQYNGVHPGVYGYYQIADMDYYWLKSIVT